ncbi:hypothetical protein IFM58399_06916 [Aspergillus lentulus]|uniref:uncharacterized protein n=1 Tax=Aspergillus lentulus TaxID=293939 RepID=UPI0013944CCF|nr:uncharacterized protein IFM58399_06916 [Aspergillus lentulus]KAF4180736.1 hypothetical protein CNMCM8060_000838 [Aspergillus lentulus]KAF4189021.1 hypothetical protein CNMCM7927_009691 [Aspergillus lentulus]KAF4194310.1 hypothetical protein CNMCM8694_007801 [Aspergillus lentulus]GFF43346.1 hypothetical protein IFM58399_06916 [Aspergillus lentulus]
MHFLQRLAAILALVYCLILPVQASGDVQAIGIDFGPEVITAAYAHASDNVSIIAKATPGRNDTYGIYMRHLRQEAYVQNNVAAMYGERAALISRITEAVAAGVKLVVSRIHDLVPLSVQQSISGSAVFQAASGTVKATLHAMMAFLGVNYSSSPSTTLTLDDIKTEFVSVFTELKAQAQNNHDIDIESATVAIPQFFNSTLADLVWTACWEAEISLSRGPQARTVLATFNQSQETQVDNPDIRYLVLDLGEFYLDSRTYNTDRRAGMREGYLPMDQWGTQSIDRHLTSRLVKGSEALRFQISLGARESDLWERVKQARLMMGNIAEDTGAKELSERDRHQDEWPLDLTGWGYQDFEEVKAVLTWKDIRVVEKAYVDSLADNIVAHLTALRG